MNNKTRFGNKSLLVQLVIAITGIAWGTVAQAGSLQLHGGGATFPAPLYEQIGRAHV